MKKIKLLLYLLSAVLFLGGCTVPLESTSTKHSETLNYEIQKTDITGIVTKVTDGDTFNVKILDDYEIAQGVTLSKLQEITVRLLLIDTPESVGEKAGMPFGDEASSYAKGLLKGRTVTLEFDEGDIKDKYDRYLAYAYLDGNRVQDYLLENGYAMVRYVYEPNTRYFSELKAIENNASKKSVGIWSLDGYVALDEGFNEVELAPDLKVIGEDIKGKAQATAEDFFDETIDLLFESFSNQ